MTLITHRPSCEQPHIDVEMTMECLACGYEISGPTMPKRCPRCFSYATLREVVQYPQQRLAALSTKRRNAGPLPIRKCPAMHIATLHEKDGVFTFDLHLDAQQVYLMIRSHSNADSKLLPMRWTDIDIDDCSQSFWRLKLRIMPGIYHLLFYMDDGTHIVPMTGRHADAARQRQLEQTLIVKGQGQVAIGADGARLLAAATTSNQMSNQRRRRRRRRRVEPKRTFTTARSLPEMAA